MFHLLVSRSVIGNATKQLLALRTGRLRAQQSACCQKKRLYQVHIVVFYLFASHDAPTMR
jgi:hypothetical protein